MVNRRQALAGLAGAAAGAAMIAAPRLVAANAGDKPAWPWTPHKLDPEECARLGYEGYYDRGMGCGHGTFVGLLIPLAKKYGAPYAAFPTEMTSYMAGGTAGWGTLCGSLNGAAAFFGLFWPFKDQVPMVNALYTWYETAELPGYQPAKAKVELPKTTSVSHSTLCHVSAGKWCQATKLAMNSKERAERCARVAAEVARQAALIVNAKIDAQKFAVPASAAVQGCTQCHAPGKEVDNLKSKMDCQPCHDGRLTTKFQNHP